MELVRIVRMMSIGVAAIALLGVIGACGKLSPVAVNADGVRLNPPPSVGHALVYHDSLKSVLMVNAGLGGEKPPASNAKTVIWRWTGRQWVVQDSSGPPVRNLAGVAYDALRNAMVIHGGSYSFDLVYGETWEWHPSQGWTNKGVSGPGVRDHTQMAYDAVAGRVILFGGQVSLDSFPSDTWSWDGTTWQSVATTGPSRRIHHTMAYEPKLRRVVLFGGHRPPTGGLGDTWSWTGTRWLPAAVNTSPRTHARLGVTAGGLILLGGFPPATAATIRRLEGSTWRALNDTPHPGQRYLTAMAYDPIRRVTVLYGGGDLLSHAIYSDTWEYSASSGWFQVIPE